MSDQQITCSECGDVFVFTEAEQSFYEQKGLASPPKRCKPCRQARKAAGGPAGGGRGPRNGAGRGGPPRFSNDVNEYRSPMSMGEWQQPRAPRDYGQREGGGGQRGGGYGARDGNRGARPNDGRGRDGGGGSRWQGQAQGQGQGYGGQRGPSEYRSPAFPEQRWDQPRRDARPARGRGGEGGRGHEGGRGNERGPRPREGAEAQPKERAPRPPRPAFDITCAECGASAQVPFKPIEGRQVFCQPCYRARRATPRENVEALDVAESDSGIVE